MRRVRSAPLLALALAANLLAACSTGYDPARVAVPPTPGSNTVFNVEPGAAPGHELIVADLMLPPNSTGEAHSHPWEEFLYVLGGSAVLDIEGTQPRTLAAGESVIIPAQTVHTPRSGPDGIRAIVIRLHDTGDPVSVPAPGAPTP